MIFFYAHIGDSILTYSVNTAQWQIVVETTRNASLNDQVETCVLNSGRQSYRGRQHTYACGEKTDIEPGILSIPVIKN
jgi:hypothetical protein